MPLSPQRHFERKREIFFVRGQEKAVRSAGNGKHRTSCDLGARKENSPFPIAKPSPPHRHFARKREIRFPEEISSSTCFQKIL